MRGLSVLDRLTPEATSSRRAPTVRNTSRPSRIRPKTSPTIGMVVCTRPSLLAASLAPSAEALTSASVNVMVASSRVTLSLPAEPRRVCLLRLLRALDDRPGDWLDPQSPDVRVEARGRDRAARRADQVAGNLEGAPLVLPPQQLIICEVRSLKGMRIGDASARTRSTPTTFTLVRTLTVAGSNSETAVPSDGERLARSW